MKNQNFYESKYRLDHPTSMALKLYFDRGSDDSTGKDFYFELEPADKASNNSSVELLLYTIALTGIRARPRAQPDIASHSEGA